MAVAGDGTVFVAEQRNNRASVFDAAGGFVRSVAVDEPVAVDADSRLLTSRPTPRR